MSTTVIDRLCRLPIEFGAGDRSAVDLVQSLGLKQGSESLSRQAILEVLRREPALIDNWQTWSENKRCDGWVFEGSAEPYLVYRFSIDGSVPGDIPYSRIGGKFVVREELKLRDRAEACAEFIVREIESIESLIEKPH